MTLPVVPLSEVVAVEFEVPPINVPISRLRIIRANNSSVVVGVIPQADIPNLILVTPVGLAQTIALLMTVVSRQNAILDLLRNAEVLEQV